MSTVTSAFRKLYQGEWWGADFKDWSLQIPKYDPEAAEMQDRAYWKAGLLKLKDMYPTMSISGIARMTGRVESWVAEVLREALKEREAEEWSMICECHTS